VSDQRFTGAVSIGSEDGRCFVVAIDAGAVRLGLPLEAGGALGVQKTVALSEDEAWCLAQQLLLACRRAARR